MRKKGCIMCTHVIIQKVLCVGVLFTHTNTHTRAHTNNKAGQGFLSLLTAWPSPFHACICTECLPASFFKFGFLKHSPTLLRIVDMFCSAHLWHVFSFSNIIFTVPEAAVLEFSLSTAACGSLTHSMCSSLPSRLSAASALNDLDQSLNQET